MKKAKLDPVHACIGQVFVSSVTNTASTLVDIAAIIHLQSPLFYSHHLFTPILDICSQVHPT